MRKGTRVRILRDMTQWKLYRGRKDVITIHKGTVGKVTCNSDSFAEVDFEGVKRLYAIVHSDLEVL